MSDRVAHSVHDELLRHISLPTHARLMRLLCMLMATSAAATSAAEATETAPEAAPGDYCLAFQRVSDYAMPVSVFSEEDPLPKVSMTISFKFRILARRQPSATTMVGFRSASAGGLLGFGTMPSGDALNVDFGAGGATIPAPGGYNFGWHHVAMSFDAAEGLLVGYFDGIGTVNKSYRDRGKVPTVKFGAGFAAGMHGVPPFLCTTGFCRWLAIFRFVPIRRP